MFIKPFFHLLPGPDDGAPDGAGAGGVAGEQQQSGNSDREFPADTPVADMTDAQKAAYYLHQNRQTDNKLKAFNGFTPQDVNAMWTQLEESETAKLSASDKAVKDAATKAAAEAKSAADADWQPKVLAAQLESAASRVIKDDEQLESFLAITDPAKFVGEDGSVDKDKVIGHLTALFGGQQQQSSNGQRQQKNWGQQSGGQPPSKPGEAGKAAADKRFRKTTT